MEWKPISSRRNERVLRVAALSRKKCREEAGVFTAEGMTILADAARDGFFPREVYLSAFAEGRLREKIEAILAASPETEFFLLDDPVFEKIRSEKGSEGVLCVFPLSVLPPFPADGRGAYLALEHLQDPGNVGTLLRTAAAFGFRGCFAVDCADPYGAKAVRASMGAVFHLPVRVCSSQEVLSFSKERGVFAIAASLGENSLPVEEVPIPENVCVWIGNEGNGLTETVTRGADVCAVIPIEKMESLNAAAAGTVFLWETARRRKK